jgi:hypothetical protein
MGVQRDNILVIYGQEVSDSVRRDILYNTLAEFSMPMEPLR